MTWVHVYVSVYVNARTRASVDVREDARLRMYIPDIFYFRARASNRERVLRVVTENFRNSEKFDLNLENGETAILYRIL